MQLIRLSAIKNAVFVCFLSVFFGILILLGIEIILRTFFSDSELSGPPPRTFNFSSIGLGEPKEIASSDAYKDQPWARQMVDSLSSEDRGEGVRTIYSPYGLWRYEAKKHTSNFRSHGSDGFRVTPTIIKQSPSHEVKIWFLGASILVGSGLNRDIDTIPSVACAELNDTFSDIQFSCSNFGVGGYNSTNELMLLMKLLMEREAPDIVILYEGISDALLKVGQDLPHYNYQLYDSCVATAGRPEKYKRIRTRLGQILLDSSQLIRMLSGKKWMITPTSQLALPTIVSDTERQEELIKVTAREYEEAYEMLLALGKGYKFHPILVLPPTLFSGKKPLSTEEKGILKRSNRLIPEMVKGVRGTYDAIITSMKHHAKTSTYIDLHSVFDETNRSLFVDFAHISPTGSRVVAQEIASHINSTITKIGVAGIKSSR